MKKLLLSLAGATLFGWIALFGQSTRPTLSIRNTSPSTVELAWTNQTDGATLERVPSLNSQFSWQTVTNAPTRQGDRFSLTLPLLQTSEFYRLRLPPVGSRVVETSPANGESGVAVTRETVLRFSAPLATNSVVTTERLHAEFGGRRVLSRVEVSSDRTTATLFYLENLPASSRVQVSFDGNGLVDATGQPLDADGDGTGGGIFAMSFTTSGTLGLANTAVIGKVFASEMTAAGTNRPLEGVIVTVDGAEETLRTTTDATGSFKLQPAPAGRFFVHVDGRTAVGSRWPGGAYYPFVGKAWDAVAGKTNNLAGGTGEIFLPLIQADALKTISATETTMVTFAASVLATNPALAGVTIAVPPNALFSENGTRGGKVGIAPVPPDRLPEPLPPGLNSPLVITIQTDGPQNFDRPVPVRFPNLPDRITGITLPPGAKTVLWSFNHDTGRWEPQGTATISADGMFAETDPGVGVRQPGWHTAAPGTPAIGPDGPGDDGPRCGAYPAVCCGPWEELKKPCKQKQELAINATIDLAVDNFINALGLPTGPGCGLGGAVGTLRVSRDCTKVGQFSADCGGIAQDGAIGAGIGCIPVFGGILGLGWGGKSVIDGVFNYRDCIATVLAACGAMTKPAAGKATLPGRDDPRLERALAALELQIRLSLAASNSLVHIFGSPRWFGIPGPEMVSTYYGFMSAISSALSASGPGGRTVTSTERAAILALPLPNGASMSEATALINRLEGFYAGLLETNLTVRSEVFLAFDSLVSVMEEALAEGWIEPMDGLRRGAAEFSSMFSPIGAEFPMRPLYYLLRDQQTGFVQRGRLSSSGHFEGIILRPNAYYSVVYFDPQTSKSAGAFFRSMETGVFTVIPTAQFLPALSDTLLAPEPDADGDNLSDRSERIVGTNPLKADTDGDGIKDGQETFMDTDPLDGVGLPVGIVGASATPGNAVDVAAENGLAVVACSGGLAIFDVANPRSPVQLAVIAAGANAVSLRERVAAVAFSNSVRLIELTAPATPITRWTRSDITVARGVVLGSDGVFSAQGALLRKLNLSNGLDLATAVLPTIIEDVAVRGELVYAFSVGQYFILRSEGSLLELQAAIPSPGSGAINRTRAFLGDLLYVTHRVGFNVFSLADPYAPLALQTNINALGFWRQIVPTGTGRGLANVSATAGSGVDVALYNLEPNGTNAQFLAQFVTPGTADSIAIAGAVGYVADGPPGLAVVNFLSPDLGTNRPSITLQPELPLLSPPRAEGNSLIRIGTTVRDDVAVHHVDFFVNGQTVSRDDSFPFELFFRVPPLSSSNSTLRLRARAVDTAGNFSDSAELVINIVADATPPKVVRLEPPVESVIVPDLVSEVSVMFHEPIITPVTGSSLIVVEAGVDARFDTGDDKVVAGSVSYDAANNRIVLTATTPLPFGQYRATIAAGPGDAATNARPRALTWRFRTGAAPRAISLNPAPNSVNVGGTLDRIVVTFDQPLPKVFSDQLMLKLLRRPSLEEVTPLAISLDPRSIVFTIIPPAPLTGGLYRLTGSGPGIQTILYDFNFRDVPNEFVSPGGFSGEGNWKYPGPLPNDVLIINVSNTVAPIPSVHLRSITAQTPAAIASAFQGTLDVEQPALFYGGLRLQDAQLLAGVSHVYGPLVIRGGNFYSAEFLNHTLNAYGGGNLDGALRFSDAGAALVNHPGSTLILSNGFRTEGLGTNLSGSIINLGTLRRHGSTNLVRIDHPKLRNDGRLEVAGGLAIANLDNEGVIDLSSTGRVVIGRASSGFSSRITGTGTLDFGELNSFGNLFANADVRGDVDHTGLFRMIAGTATLWKPLLRTNLLEVGSFGTLRLLAPSQIGIASIDGGRLTFNGEGEIGTLDLLTGATLESAALARVTGGARLSGNPRLFGPGIIEFGGSTLVSNGTQLASAQIGDATVRNTGTWLQSPGSSQGTLLGRANANNLGVFENAGIFQHATPQPFVIGVPFRNSGRATFSANTVSFGNSSNPSGRYSTQPGADVVLNGTTFDHGFAGTLDLTAGTFGGVGTIQAVGNASPKVINRAVLRVGNPTNTLQVRTSAGFEQTPTGEMIVTLAPTNSSRLNVTLGTVNLGGTLRVELSPGFSPALGQVFDVITWTSTRTNQFANTILPDLGAEKRLVVSNSTTRVSLVVTP